MRTGRRGLATLGLLGLLAVAPTAFAAPSAYILCKAVASNGDALLDGGNFQLSANATGVGNLGSYTPTVSEGGSSCDAAQPFPAGGTDLVVNEVAQPSGWINAPLYPRWTITGSGLPPAGIAGNGATATLSGANFAVATGTVTVRVTNAKARRVTICKQVIDNLTLPANQGGTFPLTYSSTSIASTNIPAMTASEGQTVCTDGLAGRPQAAALNIGDTAFAVGEIANPNPFLGNMAPGYPRTIVSDSNGSQPVGVNGSYTANLNAALLASTSGDLTVTVQNRADAPSQVLMCQRWEDDGIAPLQPASSFNALIHGNVGNSTPVPFTTPAPSASNAGQVSEGGIERCVLVTRPSGETFSTASNLLLPQAFGAFAAGYPKWEMYSAAACPGTVANSAANAGCAAATVVAGRNNGIVANPLASAATGESVEIDWAAIPPGVIPKIVLVNRSGVFGNGALPNTGNVAQLCKEVLDDGIAPLVSGNFSIFLHASGQSPRGYAMGNPSIGALATQTGVRAEGSGLACGIGGTRLALPNWITNAVAQENVWGGTSWPGNNGPVVLTIRPAAGGNTTTPASPLNLLRFTSLFDTWQRSGLNLGAGLAPVDDLDVIFSNRPASPRRVQLCMKLIDNGLNGVESNTWGFSSDGSMSSLALTEGGPEVCQTNFVYPIDDGVNPQTVAFTVSPTTAHAGYALGYPRGEYSWNGGPVTPAPAGSFTTLFAAGGRYSIVIPASVVTAQPSGTLKFTAVMQMSQQLRLCKQVLNNGNAVDDGGIFTLAASSNGAGFDTLNLSRNLTVTETTTGPDGVGVACAVANPSGVGPGIPSIATYLTAAETQPVGWNNSPGFPQWKASNGAGTVIASGAGATVPANMVLRQGPQTPDGIIEQGNITITFINRTGGSRFMQVCKELNANAAPAVITAPFGLNVATNDAATPNLISSTQTVSEGQPYTTIGNCSSQAEVPVLATTVTGSETVPANWAALGGNAPGYPQWYVVDANNAPVAGLSGTGASTGAINLAAIATPDFRIVFRNQADVSPPTIAKSFAPATIAVNGTSTVTLTLTNSSATNPAVLTSAFTDNLPSGVTSVAGSATTTCTGGSVSGTSGSVTLASGAGIPAGGSCTVTFNVTSAVSNNVAPCHQNVLPIGSLQTGLGSNAAPASASLCVSTPANLTLTKTGPSTLTANGTLVYTIALGNSGQTASGTTVTVSDVLPAGVTYVSALPGPGVTAVACSGAPALVCTLTLSAALPAAAANGAASFQIFATAPATAGSITNYASVDPSGGTTPPAAGPGCTPAASCGSATTLITTPSIVSLTKTGTASTLINGAISYTLTVTNSGGSPTAANLIVQDLVPAGEVVTAASGASCAGLPFTGDGVAVMSCTIAAPIAAGANTVFTLTATAPSVVGSITNYASTNTDGSGAPPPSPPGASCSATTPVGTVDQVMDWDVQTGATTLANFPQSFAFGSRTLAYGYVGSLSPSLLNAVAFNAALYPPNALGNGKVLRADNLGLVSGGGTPYEVTLTFTTPVHNLRFTMFDLDGSLRGSLSAADANGVGQAITLDPLLTGATFLRLDAGTNGTLTPIFTGASGGRGITSTLELQRAGVNVAVPGTVKTLVLRVWSANGGDGTAYFSDLTFNEPAGNSSCASAPTVVQAAPLLTLVKQVINDNGGVATTANFPLSATGPTSISGISGSPAVTNASVTAGSYTLGETNVAGYTAGAWSCSAGTLTGNTLVLANDQNATCTIVNNDQPATLTLVKTVTNDNGGTATISSFPLTATGPTTITGISGTPAVTAAAVSAGTYALSETNLAGYTAGAWSCTGGTLTGSSLALNSGQSATCTINNNDQGATLTLIKTVTNDSGGVATVSNFPLTATGPTTITGVSGTSAVTAAAVSAGTYALSEVNVAGYTAGSWSCVGGTLTGSSLALTSGQSATCTINNNDQPPALTLTKSGPATASANGTLVYTIALGNSGPTASGTTLTVSDVLPAGVAYVSALPGPGVTAVACSGAPSLVCTLTLSAALPAAAANGAASFQIYATAPATAGSITNYASVDPSGGTTPPAAGPGCTPAASCGSATTLITTPAIVSLTKTGTASTLVNGVINYTLTVSNSGGSPTAANLIVQDLVPAGEVVTAASGASCAGLPFTGDGTALMTCTIAAPIAVGGNTVFTLTATAPSVAGSITNYASTNTDGSGAPPPSPPGASCSATTPAGTVDQVMDWDLQSGAASPVFPPQSFVFGSRTLTYSHIGSTTPSLENALTFVGVYPPNALGNGKVMDIRNLGDMTGPGAPYELTLTFSTPVHNLRFTVFDLDGGLRGSMSAADANGVGQALTLTPLLTGASLFRVDAGTNGTLTPVFTGASGGRSTNSVAALQQAGTNVTVPGTVKTLVLRVWSSVNGDSGVYFSDLTFNEPVANTSCASAPTLVQARPLLTLVKQVINDNGGVATTANFPLSATGPTSISGISGSPAVTNASVTAGSYTLAETNLAGYTAGAWSCSAGTLTGSTLVLANDQNATCTIVNNDQPATLTLIKTVTNDNGGTATISSFPLTATGPTTITGVSGTAAVTAAAVSAGTYALSEVNLAGYTAGAWSCNGGTLIGSSLALTSGQSATCTINNNDQAATLTLVKTVTNDNGGIATVTDFPLTATGPTPITGVSGTPAVTAAAVSAGTYALSEVNVAGYAAGAWSCIGGTLTGSNLALTSGQSATCTINNNDQAATLTLIKTVTNDNGGTATVSSFPLTATGPTTITGVSGTAAVTAAAVSAGTYALSEVNLAGYVAGAWSCVGGTLTGSSLALMSGQSATCTINNNDAAATLTLVKTITNDNGGVATVSSFPLTATGPTTITGVSGTPAVTAAAVSAGTYALSETNLGGYTAGAWSCVGGTLTGSSLALTSGQSATCTINNNDAAATLTLVKTVTNDNGGVATISSFPLTATGPTTITGVSGTPAVTAAAVSAGTYALSEVNVAGYTAGAWSCVGGTLTGSSLALMSGQSATCTINNNDIAPNVSLVKALTSESGSQTGIAEPGETLTYTITLTNSTATAFAGYDFVENVPAGATLSSVSGTGVTACTTPVTGAGTCAISVANVPGSGSTTVTVVFTVANPIPAGITQIANTVTGGDTNCGVAGNTCSVTTPVAAILSVSKAVSAESISSDGVAQPGEAITYTITVRNQGGTAASNVLVNERVPANTTFVSGTPSWTCAAGAVAGTACNALVNVPAASGATPGVTTLTFVVRVADPIPVGVTRIANVVALNDQTPIDCTANPTAPACVVLPTINVGLTKTVVSVTPTGPNTYVATYQIDVVNTGGSLASYTLTDTLGFASGVSFIGAATVATTGGTLNPALAGGTYTPVNGTIQQLSASPTFLPVGASHRYTIRLPIAVNLGSVSAGACTGTAGNGLFNQANLTGSFTLGSNACGPVSGDVVRIALTKTVRLQTDANHNGYGDVGDLLGYTFVISNPGNVTLSAIQLIDPRVSTLSCAPVTANGEALTVLRSDTIASLPFEALGSLAAGDSMTCTASYALTAEDVANRRVVNTATTFGSAPSGQVASATSTAIFAQFR